MKRLLMLTLGAALAGACGSTTSDTTEPSLSAVDGATARSAAQPTTAQARPAGPTYTEVTIPAGITLPLVLTNSVASDRSAVGDAVTAELTRAITIDGRDVLPAGARLTGIVTEGDASGRVQGRAMLAFRFTTLRAGDNQYDVQASPVSRIAPATKGEDATKIGIGAGAGAVIGGLLGGKGGAAKGAIIGGGAGTGVVLATRGAEMRLGPGADATTTLTAPLTVRVGAS